MNCLVLKLDNTSNIRRNYCVKRFIVSHRKLIELKCEIQVLYFNFTKLFNRKIILQNIADKFKWRSDDKLFVIQNTFESLRNVLSYIILLIKNENEYCNLTSNENNQTEIILLMQVNILISYLKL